MANRRHQAKPPREDLNGSRNRQLPEDVAARKTVNRKEASPEKAGERSLSSSDSGKDVSSSFARWYKNLPEHRVAFADEKTVLSPLNFCLKEKLGEGGMGIVYQGKQCSVGRDIAVKFLKSDYLGDKDAARRFILEGQITGRLDHPNILPIIDVGRSQNGDLFIAMKKISGKRWDQSFAQKTPKENLEIFLRACDAIAYAHSLGIIHRDIKPENVILGEYGEIIITDWGLALSLAAAGDADDICDAQMQAGTPAYMAPEVARCEAGAINERTDVYLLGATLFEIWTGKVPHAGRDVHACLEAAAANLIQMPDKTDEVVQIALKAMAGDPAARYSSVREMQKEIREYLMHSESLSLTSSAKAEFDKPGNSYSDLSRALALFEEALKLWGENPEAQKGVMQTRLRFAAAALARRDLNLGESLLLPSYPEHQEILGKIREAQVERKSRILRLQIVSVVFMGFAISVFFIILNIKSRLETERDMALASYKALSLEKSARTDDHAATLSSLNQLKQENAQLLKPFFSSLQPR